MGTEELNKEGVKMDEINAIIERAKEKTDNVTVSLRVDRKCWDYIKKIAKENNITANELARETVEYFANRHKQEDRR